MQYFVYFKKIYQVYFLMLPPFGPSLTPFRPANLVVFNLYIAGLSRKIILTTQKEKIQDISEKRVEILIPK
jgi:hypothetical protein